MDGQNLQPPQVPPQQAQVTPVPSVLPQVTPAPSAPPPSNKKLLIIISIVILILILTAAGGFYWLQLSQKKPVGTQVFRESSPSPSPAAKFYRFVSPKYNYSLRVPQGWGRLDIEEVFENFIEGSVVAPSEEKKQDLKNHYTLMDAGFTDNQIPAGVRPRLFIRVNPNAGTLQAEVEYYKRFLESTSSDLVFLSEGPQIFQGKDAYLIKTAWKTYKGAVHEKYGKSISFTRNNLTFTIAMRATKENWENREYEKLFDEIINSFTLK